MLLLPSCYPPNFFSLFPVLFYSVSVTSNKFMPPFFLSAKFLLAFFCVFFYFPTEANSDVMLPMILSTGHLLILYVSSLYCLFCFFCCISFYFILDANARPAQDGERPILTISHNLLPLFLCLPQFHPIFLLKF